MKEISLLAEVARPITTILLGLFGRLRNTVFDFDVRVLPSKSRGSHEIATSSQRREATPNGTHLEHGDQYVLRLPESLSPREMPHCSTLQLIVRQPHALSQLAMNPNVQLLRARMQPSEL